MSEPATGAGDRRSVLFMQSQTFFGADSQIHWSIMRHLPRDRFEVHCATPKRRPRRSAASADAVERIPDVSIRPTEFGPTLDRSNGAQVMLSALRLGVPSLFSLIGLVRYVRRNGIDIVHCTEKPRDAIYGSIIARLGGARCVVHLHVTAEPWIRAGVRRAMGRASRLIGVSRFVADSIVTLGYEPEKVRTLLNGLELADWVDHDVDVTKVREEFSVPPDAPLLSSASRLYRKKGQHLILMALPEVKRHFPEVRLLVIGEDDTRPMEGASFSDELRQLADELDLRDNVIFTGWRSDVRDLMTASDIYVMPSFEEPFGMVFTEAMALRRPVVALDNGGTREVVENGKSGLLSEPGAIDELAANIVRLLGDEVLRREMGEVGHDRVMSYLNSVRMADEMATIYDEMLESVTPADSGAEAVGVDSLASDRTHHPVSRSADGQ